MKQLINPVKPIIKRALLFAALLLSVPQVFADYYDFANEGLYYTILSEEDLTVEVYGHNSELPSNLEIPAQVTYSGNTYVVSSIGTEAFYDCDGLTSVDISNSVITIGVGAFSSCTALTSVNIPNSVTTIGASAFAYCSSLTEINVDSSNPVYSSKDGVLFAENEQILHTFPGGKGGAYIIPNSVTTIGESAFKGCTALTSVDIPNSVTTIGESAFKGCTALTSVDIPNSVTTIGEEAFLNCDALTSVEIPNSVTTIGVSAFKGCEALTSVEIGNSVTTIGEGAFSSCTALTSVDIPNSVTTIGNYAFDWCKALTSVDIPNSVTTIGASAFSYCTALTSVDIPNSVTTIGASAFAFCSSLTEINVDSSNPVYSSKNGVLFADNEQILHTFPGGKEGAYIIPNSVTTIGVCAFMSCEALTSVDIPNSVTTIGESAFSWCEALTSVDIPNSVTTIGESAFYNCKKITSIYCKPTTPIKCKPNFHWNVTDGAVLYIPTGTLDAYMSVSPWKEFLHIVEMDFSGVDGVETDGAEAAIKADGGILTVSGADVGLPVEVYDAGGRMVYRGNDSRIEGLSPGIYIVRISDTVKKIIL